MKQSLTKDILKSPKNSLFIDSQPHPTLYFNKSTLPIESIDLNNIQIYNISSNASISSKRIENYKILLEKNFNQSKKLTESVDLLKQSLIEERNQRKNKLNQILNFQKQNKDLGFEFTFTQSFEPKVEPQKSQALLNSQYQEKNIISDSFLGSFRAAFGFYIELYFQKMTLALQINKKHSLMFEYILGFVDHKVIGGQKTVDIDDLSLAIYRLIKNKNINYKIIDIKYGLKKNIPNKTQITIKQFSHMLQTKDHQSYLSNPSKNILQMQFENLVKLFFQIFAQLYDTEIKFKKICKAHEKKLMKLIDESSINKELSLRILAQFIYSDVKKSKKWLILRFEQFFKQRFGNQDNTINFLKWLLKQTN